MGRWDRAVISLAVSIALAAFAGGYAHTVLGDYHLMFISAALMGFVAVGLALRIGPAHGLKPSTAELATPASV